VLGVVRDLHSLAVQSKVSLAIQKFADSAGECGSGGDVRARIGQRVGGMDAVDMGVEAAEGSPGEQPVCAGGVNLSSPLSA